MTKDHITKNHWILLLLFSLLFGNAHSAWLDNVPGVITQPDGKVINVFSTGDEFYHWVHDENNYTVIQDPVTGYWCWAEKDIIGNIISTGYPIHEYEPEKFGLKPNINITEEQYLELRQAYDDEIKSPISRAPSIGSVQQIVVFIRFNDDNEFVSQVNTYNNMFNGQGNNVNSMYQYFMNVSYQQLQVYGNMYPIASGSTVISYQSPYLRSYCQPYNPITNTNGFVGDGRSRVREIITAAANGIASQVPSNLVIDANNDGDVDNIIFIFRNGNDAEWGQAMWPHASSIPDNQPYINGKRVYRYNVVTEHHLSSPLYGVGLLAHEFAHTLGMPDLYRYTNGDKIKPVGTWCLMASTTNPPQSILAYIKFKYTDWIEEIPWLMTGGSYSLSPLGSSSTNNVYRIGSPNSYSEYFVIEYRRKTGIDNTIPGSGMLIYRVNPDLWGNARGHIYGDEVYIYRENGTPNTEGNISNAFYSQQSGRTSINSTTIPWPFLSDGSQGGLDISNIGSAGNSITFTVNNPPKLINDLRADSVSGPTSITVNQPNNYTVTVTNVGHFSASDYNVRLMIGSGVLATVSGVPLTPNQSHTYTIQWTPTAAGIFSVRGYVDYSLDQIPQNNDSSGLNVNVFSSVVTVHVTQNQSLVNNTTLFGTIQAAINACQPGGRVFIRPDSNKYSGPGNVNLTWPTNKNITVYGQMSINIQTIIDCEGFQYWIRLNNKDDQNMIHSLIIENARTGIILNNSYPEMMGLVLRNNNRGIEINNTILNEITIRQSEFLNNSNYRNNEDGVAIYATTPHLTISESKFIGNSAHYTIDYDSGIEHGSGGASLWFAGSHLSLKYNLFEDNYGTKFGANIDISPGAKIPSESTYLHIVGNSFINNRSIQGGLGLENVSSTNLTINTANHFEDILISSNIFNQTNDFLPRFPSVLFNGYYGHQGIQTNNIKYINNTALGYYLPTEPYYMGNAELVFFFGENSPRLPIIDIKNSLIQNGINMWTLEASPHLNNVSIRHSYLGEDTNLINGIITQNIYYFSDDEVENLIDLSTFQPVWTSLVKSPLIDWGHRDTNGNGIPWYLDTDDQDFDKTRKDIGAVTALTHGAIAHTIHEGPNSNGNNGQISLFKVQYAWVCFPFVDGLYGEGIWVDIPDYGLHLFDVKDMIYNMGFYNENSLLTRHDGASFSWMFNDDEENFSIENFEPFFHHNIDSRYGYKIRKNFGNSGINSHIVVETAGFQKGSTHNHGNSITIDGVIEGDTREILVGYFSKTSSHPLTALQGIVSRLVEIKTRDWSMSRDTNGVWINNNPNYRLNFGEAVSLTYTGSSPATFQWNSSNINESGYSHSVPEYFDYVEKMDYLPFYVTIPEEMISEDGGELGLFIDDICYGAEVIQGEMVPLKAYVLDSEIDFETAEIEFRIHNYTSRSADIKINKYQVFDEASQSLQVRKINLNQGNRFYQITLNDDEVSEIDVTLGTSLVGNYPNPFNPSTTISFSLAQTDNVNLSIYNIRGQLIKTLIEGSYEAGLHTIVWNGTDDSGLNMASGIYFYRLETSNKTETRRMLLMK